VTKRRTDFMRVILEEGNSFDLSVYSDIFRLGKFSIGAETKFNFLFTTYNPGTADGFTKFNFQWDFGLSLNW